MSEYSEDISRFEMNEVNVLKIETLYLIERAKSWLEKITPIVDSGDLNAVREFVKNNKFELFKGSR